MANSRRPGNSRSIKRNIDGDSDRASVVAHKQGTLHRAIVIIQGQVLGRWEGKVAYPVL